MEQVVSVADFEHIHIADAPVVESMAGIHCVPPQCCRRMIDEPAAGVQYLRSQGVVAIAEPVGVESLAPANVRVLGPSGPFPLCDYDR